MAEAKKDLTQVIIWVIGLIFICGMTYQSIGSMDKRVSTNTSDIKSNTAAIHSNELTQKEIYTRLDGISDIKDGQKELREEFKEFKKYLMDYDFNPKDK